MRTSPYADSWGDSYDGDTAPLVCKILETIFYLCSRNAADDHSFPALTLSHVCRQWRRVALNSTRLWATIENFSSRNMMYLMNGPWEDLPLRVRWNSAYSSRVTEDGISRATDIVTFVRSCAATRYHWQTVSRVLLASSTVRTFSFHIERHLSMLYLCVQDDAGLSLNSRSSELLRPPSTQLRALFMSSVTGTCISVSDLVDVFLNAPLEHIHFRGILFVSNAGPNLRVHLRALRACEFISCTHLCHLLNYIQFPDDSTTTLNIVGGDYLDMELGLTNATKRMLHHVFRGHTVLDLTSLTFSTGPTLTADNSFSFYARSYNDLIMSAATFGLRLFDWSSITVLHLDFPEMSDGVEILAGCWAALFKQLAALTTIVVEPGMALRPLVFALCPEEDPDVIYHRSEVSRSEVSSLGLDPPVEVEEDAYLANEADWEDATWTVPCPCLKTLHLVNFPTHCSDSFLTGSGIAKGRKTPENEWQVFKLITERDRAKKPLQVVFEERELWSSRW
ncbi:hypothetical protein EUX98_g7817 [Antrodiella citrinella]|uniref:Uncharacterized protein n=1 Tax=Antrodiella citrinella TaxID=2447956 RepID=A0A4S4MSP2_9APHY|nr:hypothetical protein EUX98_g7817 [Antrodiella citrinella]